MPLTRQVPSALHFEKIARDAIPALSGLRPVGLISYPLRTEGWLHSHERPICCAKQGHDTLYHFVSNLPVSSYTGKPSATRVTDQQGCFVQSA